MISILTVVSLQDIFATEEITIITEETQNKIDELIDVEDGYFELSDKSKQEIISLVGKETLDAIEESLNNYNDYVEDGEIEITDNGTIIDVNDEELNVQGGNINKQKSYWWGIKNYMSNSKANSYLKKINNMKQKAATITNVSNLISGFSGACGAPILSTASFLVSLISDGMKSYLNIVYSKTNNVYKKISKSTGLVVEFKIWLAVNSYSQ